MRFLLLSLAAVMSLSLPAHAQETAASDADHATKIELVNKMHEIRPARKQVDEAINQVARNLPAVDRDRFIKMVENAFDYDKLEQLSKDTMVDLFTVAELQKMVDYFGSPEAQSIGEKLPKYQAKLQPEIIHMLDAAMIQERTGGPADAVTAPAATPAVNKEETPKP